MDRSIIIAKVRQWLSASAAREHRCLIVVEGQSRWASDLSTALLQEIYPKGHTIWLRCDSEGNNFTLGQEIDALVLDFHNGINIDKFTQAMGAVRSGGMLAILTPPLSELGSFDDPEHRRFAVYPQKASDIKGYFLLWLKRHIENFADCKFIKEDGQILSKQEPMIAHKRVSCDISGGPLFSGGHYCQNNDILKICKSSDQASAVKAIMTLGLAAKPQPLLMIADRGRGKSGALGIGAGFLAKTNRLRLIVSSIRKESTESMLYMMGKTLRLLGMDASDLKKYVERIHPAELVFQEGLDKTLIFVDEAASIPVATLKRMVHVCPRIVLATTIHGYEGNGGGFAVRFVGHLEKKYPLHKSVNLETPIRYAPDDPVERFSYEAFLLGAKPCAFEIVEDCHPDLTRFEWISRETLISDKLCLSEAFGLLVLAHYRTRPSDLRRMLDATNMRMGALLYNGHVVSVAVCASEGSFGTEDARAIVENGFRPRGHMLPETLGAHLGDSDAPTLAAFRVVRIATHPGAQKRGLASKLISRICTWAAMQRYDYVGAGFSLSNKIIRFWLSHGFHILRVSVNRGSSSGEHSVIVVNPVSNLGNDLVRRLCVGLGSTFAHSLMEGLRCLETQAVPVILQHTSASVDVRLNSRDMLLLEGYISGNRIYDAVAYPLWKALLLCLGKAEAVIQAELSSEMVQLLVQKVCQKWSWEEVATYNNFPSVRCAMRELRRAFTALFREYNQTSNETR